MHVLSFIRIGSPLTELGGFFGIFSNFALIDLWPLTWPRSVNMSRSKVVVLIEDYAHAKLQSIRFNGLGAIGLLIFPEIGRNPTTHLTLQGCHLKTIENWSGHAAYEMLQMGSSIHSESLITQFRFLPANHRKTGKVPKKACFFAPTAQPSGGCWPIPCRYN